MRSVTSHINVRHRLAGATKGQSSLSLNYCWTTVTLLNQIVTMAIIVTTQNSMRRVFTRTYGLSLWSHTYVCLFLLNYVVHICW